MHVVITGANGFVGKALAQEIVYKGTLGGKPVSRLSLLDLTFDRSVDSALQVDQYAGDLADSDWLDSVIGSQSLDAIFHLASIPGGAAESNYDLARAVNLDATQRLLELSKKQVEGGGAAPLFVFASSIAVFGHLTEHVTDNTALRPQMTYGAQKVIGEVLVEDFSRRGWIDGRSLRLPGVLARPRAPTGQLSAFLSDIIRELAAGRPFVCPTSPGAMTWASSLPCIVNNLLQGAAVTPDKLIRGRTFTLPTLCFSMQRLVEAIGEVYKTPVDSLISWQPDERIESLFGSFPSLETPAADNAGFTHDGDLKHLVSRALINT